MDAAALRASLREQNIDLIGIADAGTLLLSYPPRPAQALMPTARSVIVMGVAHSLGAVQAPGIHLWTRNKMQTSRLLDRVAESTARELERRGYLSLPISADKPADIYKLDPETGEKLPHTRTAGQLSLKHAAVSAGLGEIGLSPTWSSHENSARTSAWAASSPRRRWRPISRARWASAGSAEPADKRVR